MLLLVACSACRFEPRIRGRTRTTWQADLAVADARAREAAAEAIGLLGTDGAPCASALAARLAVEPEAAVRRRLAWALGKHGAMSPEAVAALGAALEGDPDAGVRERAARSLARAGATAHAAGPALAHALADADPVVRAAVGDAWREVGPHVTRATAAAVTPHLAASDPRIVGLALGALAAMGPAAEDALPALVAMLEQRRAPRAVLRTLSALDAAAAPAVPAIAALLSEPRRGVREAAIVALRELGATASTAAPALEPLAAAADDPLSLRAALALARVAPTSRVGLQRLVRGLEDPDGETRRESGEALLRIEAPPLEALPIAERLLADPSPEVQKVALRLLRAYGPAAEAAIPALVGMLVTTSTAHRWLAANALGAVGGSAAPAVAALLTHTDGDVRAAALWSLGRMPGADVAPQAGVVAAALGDENAAVRLEAARALGRLGVHARGTAHRIEQRIDDEPSPRVRELLRTALERVSGRAGSEQERRPAGRTS